MILRLPQLPWTRLSGPAKRALLVHALHWQAVQIGNLYVGVFLFRASQTYALPAWHAFCSYLAIPVGYWIAGLLTRRHGPGASLRLGLAVYGIFQAAIFLLGPDAVHWAGSLGFFWGLGVGLYWQAWVLLMVDISEEGSDRDAVLGSNQAVYFLATFTGAPLAGWFLSRADGTQGYPYVFGIGFTLFVLAWIVSLPLLGKPQHGSSSLKRLLIARKPAGWNAGIVTALLMGAMSVGTMFLPMLMSYQSGGGEGHGGLYAALTAMGGFLASWMVAHLGHPERRKGFLLWSAVAFFVAALPMALTRSYGILVIYGLGSAMAMSVFNIPLFAAQIRIVESNPRFKHRRADAMLLREIPLNVGRALACAVVLWGVTDLSSPALGPLFGVLAFIPFINYFIMRRYLGGSSSLTSDKPLAE